MAMLRAVAGVVVGSIVWMAVFMALAIATASVWPDYASHGRTWFETETYTFEPAMSAGNALFWFAAEVAAGAIAVLVARRREAAWVLAAVLMAYMCFMHLYYVWPKFPWWYNLAVALPSGAAVLVGGMLASRTARRAFATA